MQVRLLLASARRQRLLWVRSSERVRTADLTVGAQLLAWKVSGRPAEDYKLAAILMRRGGIVRDDAGRLNDAGANPAEPT